MFTVGVDGCIYVNHIIRKKNRTDIECLARFIHLSQPLVKPLHNVGITSAIVKVIEKETLFETIT